MRKRILWSGLAALLLSLQAVAQESPRYELFAGYGYVRPPGGQANLNGWHVSAAANMNHWLGVAVELGGQYGTQTLSTVKANAHFNSLSFGPRFTYRNNERLEPFAHVLFGLARGKWSGPAAVAGEETSFGTAMGGGVDAKITEQIRIRIIQAEHVRTRFGATPENLFRLATGVVFAF